MQEHDELEDVAQGQQPLKQKDKAGLLSKALRAPLGTRTLSLHNLLDQAPFLEGQQVQQRIHACNYLVDVSNVHHEMNASQEEHGDVRCLRQWLEYPLRNC